MMLHKPREAAQRTIMMMGEKKVEMMERGHAGSERMYTRIQSNRHTQYIACAELAVQLTYSFLIKVKLY